MVERRVGFYTSRPFWAGSAIDLAGRDVQARFTTLMSEVVFQYKLTNCEIGICRDGLLMLRVDELEKEAAVLTGPDLALSVAWWGRYLDCVNVAYLLLESAILEVMNLAFLSLSEITTRDIIRLTFENGRQVGSSIAMESVVSVHQMARYVISYGTTPLEYDHRLATRVIVPQTVFDKLSAELDTAVSDSTLIQNLAAIARSVGQFKIGNYSTSLVLAWFVVESVLNMKWERLLATKNVTYPDGQKRINAGRHCTLIGRDYPISVVCNMLELNDQLPFDQFKTIDRVRGYRNKIVHGDPTFTCSALHSQEAYELGLRLATEGSGLAVRVNSSYSVIGP